MLSNCVGLNGMLFFHSFCKNLIQIKLNRGLILARSLKLNILAVMNIVLDITPSVLCLDSVMNLCGMA